MAAKQVAAQDREFFENRNIASDAQIEIFHVVCSDTFASVEHYIAYTALFQRWVMALVLLAGIPVLWARC